MSLEQQNR
jgi:hypothetical protein